MFILVGLTIEDSSSQKTERFQAPLPPLLLYFSFTQMTTSAPSMSLRWLESFTIWINIKIELSKDIFQFLQTNDHVHSRDHYHLDLVFWKPPGVRSGRRSCASSGPQTRCTCSSQTPWWPIQIISLAEVSVKRTIFSVSFLTLYSWLWKRQDDQELCETVNTNWKKGPVSLSESHAHMDLPLPERPQGSHLQGNQNHDLPCQEVSPWPRDSPPSPPSLPWRQPEKG